MQAACGKRPISDGIKRTRVGRVEEAIHREFDREVESRAIGEKVAALLREIDEISYVRFASEYYQFENVGEIMDELEVLRNRVRDTKEQGKLFEGEAT